MIKSIVAYPIVSKFIICAAVVVAISVAVGVAVVCRVVMDIRIVMCLTVIGLIRVAWECCIVILRSVRVDQVHLLVLRIEWHVLELKIVVVVCSAVFIVVPNGKVLPVLACLLPQIFVWLLIKRLHVLTRCIVRIVVLIIFVIVAEAHGSKFVIAFFSFHLYLRLSVY